MLLDWKDLRKQRVQHAATILGSGQTVNELTGAMWQRLKERTDLWALNNWVYHPTIVPDFYAIETKWYGFDILKRRLAEKRKAYNNVNFIFQRDKQIKMKDGSARFIRDVVWPDAKVFEFGVVSRDPKRTSKLTDAVYDYHPSAVTKSYQASLTAILEMVRRIGYTTIILVGVDLKNSYYFWSDGDPKWGEVHHLTNKAHEGKDPKKPHGTALVKGFVVNFSDQMWSNKNQMFVSSIKSALWPAIPMCKWREL